MLAKAGVLTALLVAVTAAPAAASHSWGSYHWARTANPFTLKLGDNVTFAWDSYLVGASTDWSKSTVVDTPVVPGLGGGRKCPARSGRVEVCNYTYGRNGWLGVASITVSNSHITSGTVKLNDTYYSTATYDTPVWRGMVVCQEVGHTLGLDHQDESGANLGTCMDYANNPDERNKHPDGHDYEQLAAIYAHLDSSTTLAAGATSSPQAKKGLKRLDDDLFVEDLGNGKKRFVHVYWVDPQRRHEQAPEEG